MENRNGVSVLASPLKYTSWTGFDTPSQIPISTRRSIVNISALSSRRPQTGPDFMDSAIHNFSSRPGVSLFIDRVDASSAGARQSRLQHRDRSRQQWARESARPMPPAQPLFHSDLTHRASPHRECSAQLRQCAPRPLPIQLTAKRITWRQQFFSAHRILPRLNRCPHRTSVLYDKTIIDSAIYKKQDRITTGGARKMRRSG
jgi:hypothetical protein